jgi:hypothetical protein
MSGTFAPAAKIRLAETAPAACASCRRRDPDERHVDFGAAGDYGMAPAPDDIAGAKLVSIDDLIVCERCLTDAASVLGLEDVGAQRHEAERLERECETANAQLAAVTSQLERLAEAQRTGEELADLLGHRPTTRPKRRRTTTTERNGT